METHFASTDSLAQLDWPWVVDQIRARLRTARARERCAELLWVSGPDAALETMREVEEARALLAREGGFPLGNAPDIRPFQPRIVKGAVLQPDELLEIASWMETVEALRRYLFLHRQRAPLLYRYARQAPLFSHLLHDIRSCVDERGEVRDEASPELTTLRRKAKRIHEQIHQKLHTYLTAPEYEDLLQDRFYTIKEDRYVLPIKTSQRSFVEGIVLGSSQSGATLFIEPREIVELNNMHKLALVEIQRETNRILQEISEHLRADAMAIAMGDSFLTRMDLIRARAEFSNALKANIPSTEHDKGIDLRQARHPYLLLARKDAVANDIRIAPPVRTLLVTGPNAGGKTVLLKTVGLLALMVRAGLALPAGEGSNMPFFDHIFSDIGDTQSLEKDRSTFSGHIERIAGFLSSVGKGCLALLDEILIGTDPEEGSRLAQAILEYLSEAGATTLATTHYLPLKALAAKDPRFENASLGFDPATLEPTFCLSQGAPGTSNALTLASRLGLPERILQRARALQGETRLDIEALLAQIQEAKRDAEAERERWRRASEEVQALREALEQERKEVERREAELKRKYRQRLEQAFRETLRELERLRRGLADPDRAAAVRAAVREVRERRNDLFERGGPFHQPPHEDEHEKLVRWEEVRPGDTVYLPEWHSEARVLKLPDRKGMVVVEVKGFRMHVEADKVCRPAVQRRTIRTPERVSSHSSGVPERPACPPPASTHRCDLRGLTSEEAVSRTAQDLDRAFREGTPRLVLIHGLGKGILRDAVRRALSQAPYPITFRPGAPEEGGDGVTVVEFRAREFPPT